VPPTGEIAAQMERRIQEEERKKKANIENRKKEREQKIEDANREAEEADVIGRKVDKQIKNWVVGKSIHNMLNDLDKIWAGAPIPAKRLSKVHSSESELKKAYMKAIRVIHPDKNVGDNVSVEQKCLSKAVFTVLQTSYEKSRG